MKRLMTLLCGFVLISCQNPSASELDIVGGEEVSDTWAPEVASTVSIGLDCSPKGVFCTGTVIGPNHIVTAGHCLNQVRGQEIFIGVGPTAMEMCTKVIGSSIHPNFNARTLEHDIGVIAFGDRPFRWFKPQPVRIAEPADGMQNVLHVGYGTTGALDSDDFGILRTAYSRVEPLSYDSRLLRGEIDGKGTCVGDSGGPVYIDTGLEAEPSFELIGMTSRAEKNPDTGTFDNHCLRGDGIYLVPYRYLEWIESAFDEIEFPWQNL